MDSSSISSMISNSINEMISNIFSSIDNSIYQTLDKFTFIDSDILNDNFSTKIFGVNGEQGILLIANSLILGYLIYYAFKLLFSHLGLTQVEKPFVFLFKLILCSILMNSSIFICEEIIYLISLLSTSIRDLGETVFNAQIGFSSLILKLNSILIFSNNSQTNIFSLDGILHSIISISEYNPNTYYHKGDKIIYNNIIYTCIKDAEPNKLLSGGTVNTNYYQVIECN